MHEVDHTKNIIEVNGVSFSYDGRVDVLKDVSLSVHRGDFIGLVGSNGSGKTTLLKLILGILVPKTGSIRLFGEDIAILRDRSRIGYVPQKASSFYLNFPVSVREAVLMGRFGKRGLFHRMKSEDWLFVDDVLARVNMASFADRLVGELSGGQQQRVLIARALACEPEILFLDEPTTGVDQSGENEFYELLRSLNRKLDITLVLVSHDIDRMAREAMHLVCVDQTVKCYLSPEEYFARRGEINEKTL